MFKDSFAAHILETGQYKTRTADYELGIKYGPGLQNGNKIRTEVQNDHWNFGIV